MPARNLQELLAAAGARVAAVRGLLARPRACDFGECVTRLREAQGYLEWLRDSVPAVRPAAGGLRAQAVALAVEIHQLGVLLEQAARLGSRWLERLRSRAGYTAAGSLEPLAPRGRLSVLG